MFKLEKENDKNIVEKNENNEQWLHSEKQVKLCNLMN